MALELRCTSKKTVVLGEHAEVDIQCGRQENHRVRHSVKHSVKDVTIMYSWPLTDEEKEKAA